MQLFEKLQTLFPDSSRNQLRDWVKQGRILVDETIAKSIDTVIREGQKITLTERKKFAPHGLKILYEDRDIVIVDKPAGLLSVSTDFEKELCVHQILKRRYYKAQVFPVHRLDRETSGVLAFAYTSKARDVLKKKFETHDIEREYDAIVTGVPSPTEGTWQSFLYEDKNYYVRSSDNGKLAITHYRTLATKKDRTLLRLKLQTGRKNQIRVHTSEAGFPIVGDLKYGYRGPDVPRLYLHASWLAFEHPTNGRKMKFVSEYQLTLQ